MQGLWTIAQRPLRGRMDVDQDHVYADNDSLRGYMMDVRETIWGEVLFSDRVRRIDANRHTGQSLDNRDVGEVDEVAMGIAEVRLDAAQTKYNVAVAFAGDVLACVQRFFQCDAHAAFVQ